MLVLFFLSVLSLSCAVKPPDVPACVELFPWQGWCRKTISDEEFYVDDEHPYKFDGKTPKTWWEIRPTMIMLPPYSWGETKKFIILICKKNNQCSEVTSWDRTVNRIDEKLGEKP